MNEYYGKGNLQDVTIAVRDEFYGVRYNGYKKLILLLDLMSINTDILNLVLTFNLIKYTLPYF